ncbi:MAG: putative glycoside hydrolase [Pirellulaceae bacterium]|nr:putative glycoside hydrolase [Pirellulaceae bacterium]
MNCQRISFALSFLLCFDFASAHTVDFLINQVAGQDRASLERMPEFSWDTLPLYVHVRKAVAFTPEELKFLAAHPLITFEKTTGSESYDSTDAGTIKAAEAVKQINPAAKVLFYRNVIVHYSGYSFDQQLEAIRKPFLVDKQGNDKLIRGRVSAYDLGNDLVRKWWVDSMAAVCNRDSIDGLFLDGNVKVLTPFLKSNLPNGKKDEVIQGFDQMMRQTRETLKPNKLMVANILRARFADGGIEFIDRFDGSYLEGFEHTVGGMSKADYIAKGISSAQKAASQGKIIALSLNIGASSIGEGIDEVGGTLKDLASVSQERLDYCIALFLVMADRYSYLCIHDGYDVNAGASKLWMHSFPEYKKRLGRPTAPAERKGYQYSREFEYASVRLDIETGKGRIEWK